MRFLGRLHACVAASVFFILYFTWLSPSSQIQDSLHSVWKGTAHRVVVFGDDWSDTGKYRVAPPPQETVRDRDPSRGVVWVETLCEELKCDSVDNFARSMPLSVALPTIGSMVDSEVFINATRDAKQDETLMLFDFKTQMEQFLEREKKKARIPTRLRKMDEWTIFTVLFGLWELMEYSTLDKDAAVRAIDQSLEELMRNLDILAEHVDTPLKVIIPRLVDVTFLPRYSSRKNDSATAFASDQHQTVFLWTYWNTKLSQAAENWGKGDIFVPDLHGIIMNQVRAKQLYSKQISDATGFGKQAPLFDDVEQPCLAAKTDGNGSYSYTVGVEMCAEPARHLFWDDIRLNGPAHELIGKDAARLVHGNNTVNRDARQRAIEKGTTTGQGEAKKEGAKFDLKFPPGY